MSREIKKDTETLLWNSGMEVCRHVDLIRWYSATLIFLLGHDNTATAINTGQVSTLTGTTAFSDSTHLTQSDRSRMSCDDLIRHQSHDVGLKCWMFSVRKKFTPNVFNKPAFTEVKLIWMHLTFLQLGCSFLLHQAKPQQERALYPSGSPSGPWLNEGFLGATGRNLNNPLSSVLVGKGLWFWSTLCS